MQNVEDVPIPNRASVARSSDAQALDRLAAMAEQLGEVMIGADVQQLVARIKQGRFFVACVGQFKRGKSTLLNALVGEPILPAGVVPVTTVPTILRFGESLGARVRLSSGEWTEIAIGDVEDYVSEVRNPENSKRVAGLEVF